MKCTALTTYVTHKIPHYSPDYVFKNVQQMCIKAFFLYFVINILHITDICLLINIKILICGHREEKWYLGKIRSWTGIEDPNFHDNYALV